MKLGVKPARSHTPAAVLSHVTGLISTPAPVQDNSSMYGKLCIFIFAAWAGTANGGVIAGLGMCGVVLAGTSQASTLMQDFRTGCGPA